MPRDICLGEKESLYETKNGYIIYKVDIAHIYCEICLIEIDNAEKNQGEGTKLLNDFLAKMQAKGIAEFYLDAWVTDEGIYPIEVLVGFYKKFGFTEDERMQEDEGVRVFMSLEKEVVAQEII